MRRAAATALMLAAAAVAAPAVVASSTTSSVPSCHLSTTTMAATLRLKTLEYVALTPKSNLCTFRGLVKSTHYHQLIQIELVPGIKTIYEQARAAAEHKAVTSNDRFADLPPAKGDTYKAAFSVTGTTSAAGLPRCQPDHKLPEYPPPKCATDPKSAHDNVSMYGPYKPTGKSVMVSVAVDGQYGDVQLSSVRALARDILLGRDR